MDGAEAGTVASSHVLVESLDGLGAAHLTELLVHVVGTGARVVAEPDTEVLDLQRALLSDLEGVVISGLSVDSLGALDTYHVQGDDLTVGLLQLAELSQEVPEPRLSDNGVGRKNTHAVQLGGGVRLGGQVTPDDLVLVKTPCKESVSFGSYGIHCAQRFSSGGGAM